MKQIRTADVTMKQISEDFRLSFKEKIEFSKLLDKLGVDVIELEGIKNPRSIYMQETADSFWTQYTDICDKDLKAAHPKAYEYAMAMTEKELSQAAEGLYHNLNSLQSRSGNQLKCVAG